LLVAGWGLAQHPFVVAPDVTFTQAAAPAATQRAVLVALGAGVALLVPALIWLMRVFRLRRRQGTLAGGAAAEMPSEHGPEEG
jgi:cytochrome d ubiquinol oxidase subunit II